MLDGKEYSSIDKNTYTYSLGLHLVNVIGLLGLFQASMHGKKLMAWLSLGLVLIIHLWRFVRAHGRNLALAAKSLLRGNLAFSLLSLGCLALSNERPTFLLLAYLMALFVYPLLQLASNKIPLLSIPWSRNLYASGYIVAFVFLFGFALLLMLFLPDTARNSESFWEWLPVIGGTVALGVLIATIPGMVREDISVLLFGTLLAYSFWRMQWLMKPWLMPHYFGWALLTLTLFGLLSVWSKKIDVAGGIAGSLIGLGIFMGAGFQGLLLLLLFFVMGSGASSWKMKWKQAQGLAEKNKGKRSINNALANGAVAAWCGLLAWRDPTQALLWQTMLAASFAAATADTLSSELGNVYGKRYLDILSGKPGKRGDDGVISLEGTLIGALGAVVIAVAFAMTRGELALIGIVALAGIFANVIDSVLGASLQRQGLMNNDTVNFVNTLSAALLVYVLH